MVVVIAAPVGATILQHVSVLFLFADLLADLESVAAQIFVSVSPASLDRLVEAMLVVTTPVRNVV